MSNTPKKECASRSLRRFILCTTGIIIVCFLLGYLVLFSGFIERYAIPLVSNRILGARLDLRIDSLRPLRILDIQLQQEQTAPLLKTESVTVRFQHLRSCSRPIIDTIDILHPQFHLDARETAQYNYTFLQPYLRGGESGSAPSYWLPQRINIDGIDIKVDMPKWSASISNVNLAADIEGFSRITARVSGDTVLAAWQTGHDWLNIPLPQGTVDANIAILPDTVDMQANILLPDFILLKGKASMVLQPHIQLDMMLETLQLDAPVFGELVSRFSPIPIGYDNIKIAPFQLNISMENSIPVIKNAECNIQAMGLLLGTPDAPWYSGNLGITLQGEYGEGSQAAWSATLNQGQQVSGIISTKGEEIQVEAAVKNWTKEYFITLWPEPYAALKSWLPDLGETNGEVEFAYKERTIDFNTSISTGLPSGTSAAITSSGAYNLDSDSFAIKGQGSVGNGTYTFDGGKQEKFSTSLSADSLAASDISSCLPWDALKAIQGNVTGEATVSIEEDGGYAFKLNAEAAAPAYDNWKLPETLGTPSLDCTGSLAPDFTKINAAGTFNLADNASVKADSFLYDIGVNRITSDFDGTISLASITSALGFDSLWGDITAAGKFSLNNWKQLAISPLRLTSDTLGYGDYSLPYGEELVIESPLQLDMTDFSISAGPSRITLGEGSTITADVIHINADHSVAAPAISLETDFAPLVAKQFLDAADGQLKIAVEDFLYEKDTVAGKIIYDCNAAHLVLPGKLADIRGLTATGSAALPPSPDNKGTLQIEELMVGGSRLQKTRGNILLGEQGIILEDVNFELFGGGVVARASVNIIGTAFSISVSGEVQNLDLSIFTSEFEPPSLVLTGRVNGTFKSEFTAQQLRALDVDLTANDGFSMNRDMVEQLLMSQYVDEMSGGRQMIRVLQSVIGKDEQRKFDQVRMVLGLENDRITGYAKLESEKLNLTVDIKADPQALLEAIKTRQQ